MLGRQHPEILSDPCNKLLKYPGRVTEGFPSIATVSSDLPSTADEVAFVLTGLCTFEVQNADLAICAGDEDATIVVAIDHATWQQFQNLSATDREYVTSQVQHELAVYDRKVGPLNVPQTVGEDELPVHYLGLYRVRTAPSLVLVKTPVQLAAKDSSWDAGRQKLIIAMLKECDQQIKSKHGQASLADREQITVKFPPLLAGRLYRLMKSRKMSGDSLFELALKEELAKSGWDLRESNFMWRSWNNTNMGWYPIWRHNAHLIVRELKLPELGS